MTLLSDRMVTWTGVPGARAFFSEELVSLLSSLNDQFSSRIADARAVRASVLKAAHAGDPAGARQPAPRTGPAWSVPVLPAELKLRGAEISGPAESARMMINALNSGPEGTRAVGYLDDDEDAGGHSLESTVTSALNRRSALEGTLTDRDEARGKSYSIESGPPPFMIHRERGWHLDEAEVTVDGAPVSATLLGLAGTLIHAGRVHSTLGQGLYMYLPKCESVAEVELYRDVFEAAQRTVPHLAGVEIRAIILIESLPAVFQMEEMLRALSPYGAGLNAARWDLKASLIEFSMTDASALWPDRFDVDIKRTPFLRDIFRSLVHICDRHGAVAIGGMATPLPSQDSAVNAAAAAAIRADKTWEAAQGFRRGWVAHTFHMEAAAAPFRASAVERPEAEELPVRIETPVGAITEAGTRRNVRTLIEYLDGWLGGRGARGINALPDDLAPSHPALMEDLATARISVAQTAQRLFHGAGSEDTGRRHTPALLRELLDQEGSRLMAGAPDDHARERYGHATALTAHWISDYLELDFRSLGSWTRAELLERAERQPTL